MTKTWGGKGLFHITDYSPSLRDVRVGTKSRNLEQELKQRPWKGAAYWLAPHGLLISLSYITEDHQPGGGPIQRGWVRSHQSLIKKVH